MNRYLRFLAHVGGTVGVWQIGLSPWLIDRAQEGIGLVVVAILLLQVCDGGRA
jgi:hypothetical protein